MLQATLWAGLGTGFTFLLTTLGAATVFLFHKTMDERVQKVFFGFAAGVMIAASVWSMLIPAIEDARDQGLPGWLPAALGFILGGAGMIFLDWLAGRVRGRQARSRTSSLFLAVTLHNIPEGMAVGVTLAAVLEHNADISLAAALALSIGIAIQNFPEGAIVSMPLRAAGNTRRRAFAIGVLSGAVEPVAAVVTMLLAAFIVPALPYLLAFAAGAMLYVVVEEIIPETQTGRHSDLGTVGFALGFLLMMLLDVVLG